jgi:hypothetical protein
MFCAYTFLLLFLVRVELRYKIRVLIKFMMDPEKARLQAEAKAAEDARMRAEAEAAAEIRRKRELEREAARQALLQASEHIIYCMHTALFVLGFLVTFSGTLADGKDC